MGVSFTTGVMNRLTKVYENMHLMTLTGIQRLGMHFWKRDAASSEWMLVETLLTCLWRNVQTSSLISHMDAIHPPLTEYVVRDVAGEIGFVSRTKYDDDTKGWMTKSEFEKYKSDLLILNNSIDGDMSHLHSFRVVSDSSIMRQQAREEEEVVWKKPFDDEVSTTDKAPSIPDQAENTVVLLCAPYCISVAACIILACQ